MSVLHTTSQKIEAILDRIRALKAGSFAQHGSKEALEEIEQIFVGHLKTVEEGLDGTSSEAVVIQHCNVVLEELFRYLPILGFLHRSKSASNPFEVYGPLLRLAQKVIGPETKLIMSSEWDFSPFTFVRMPGLPHFVLIGVPASEAGNALLIPLAGHEFGHPIWLLDSSRGTQYQSELIDSILLEIRSRWKEFQGHFHYVQSEGDLQNDMFGVQTWAPALTWALRQCEEVFCDFVGLWLFGEGYLHAFAYLLAPGMASAGAADYPEITQRVENLTRAAARYGVAVPSGYAALFDQAASRSKSRKDFLRGLADKAAAQRVDALIVDVEEYMVGRGIARCDPAAAEQVFRDFEILVPSQHPTDLAAIVNAGWKARHTQGLWASHGRVAERRNVVLNELVLKSAQVLEFQELIQP